MADDNDDLPKVVGGRLTKPYPIRSKADMNRALVLPPPIDERPAAKKPAAKPAPAATADEDAEQPKGGFDYIRKRRNLQKQLGVRGPARRSASRVSRA